MGLNTVISGIGAVAGFIIGGPAGAKWGYAIGATIGNSVDPQVIKGPSLGEIPRQTSQEGLPIPIVYGLSPPIPGNIIACSEPNIVVRKKRVGFLGPKIKEERVYRTYAIGVCEGPIDGFVRVWRNNKLVFDATEDTTPPEGGSAKDLINWFGAGKSASSRHFYLGTYDQTPDQALEAIFGVGTTCAHRGLAYMVCDQENLTEFGGAVPQWQFQVLRRSTESESESESESEIPSYPVAEAVRGICERAGVTADQVDTSELEGLSMGGILVTNQYAAADSLHALSQAFRFDAADYDGVLHFIRRGGNSVATIDESEMVVDDEEGERIRRAEPTEIPRVLNLNYYDTDSGSLTSAKQTSVRVGESRSLSNASMQTPVVMSANEAAQAVSIAHAVLVDEAKGEVQFSLPDSFIWLTPASPIILQWNGRSDRVRIVQCDILDGYQRYIAVHDRQSAYTSIVEGIPQPPTTPLAVPPVEAPLLAVLDIPPLADWHDRYATGIYIAVGGRSEFWTGSLVRVSSDGGLTFFDDADVTAATIIGELLTGLGNHAQAYPDQINACRIRLDTYNAELEATDLEGMMNRQNLAAIGSHENGWELVNFANADEDSDGLWTLSHWLRGRRGTAPRAHPAGSLFVLLTGAPIQFAPLDVVHVGRTLTIQALGSEIGTDATAQVLYTGSLQKERAVAYLQAERDGDQLSVAWMGVGRLGGGSNASHGIYWFGYQVTVTDGTLSQTVNTMQSSAEVNVAGYASPLTVTVAQLNKLTGAGPPTSVQV